MGYIVRRLRGATLVLAAATPEPATTRPIPMPKATSVPAPGVPALAACTPAAAVDDIDDEVVAPVDEVVALELLAEEPAVSLDVLIDDECAELDAADDVWELEWVVQSEVAFEFPRRPPTPGRFERIEPMPSAPTPPVSH